MHPFRIEPASGSSRANTMVIAGGTDMVQLLRAGVVNPDTLRSLDVTKSAPIAVEQGTLRLPALATMADAAADPAVIRHWPAISEALLAAASPQIRNLGTVGGNLLQRTRCLYFRDTAFPCNKRQAASGCPAIPGRNRELAIFGGSDHCIASHPSDMPVALVAFDATIETDRGRRLPLAEFYRLSRPPRPPTHARHLKRRRLARGRRRHARIRKRLQGSTPRQRRTTCPRNGDRMMGNAISRVDAPLKTQGRARYAAEFLQDGTLHAVIVGSTIPKGRVTGTDTSAAERLPGIAAIITTASAERLHVKKASPQTVVAPLLQDDQVRFQGQPVAVVVAETFETAQQAAALVTIQYDRATDPVTDMHAAVDRAYKPKNFRNGSVPADSHRGDPDTALAGSPVRVEAVYETPIEYHNPMEPHATVASWEGDRLTVWTATQGVSNAKETLATFFTLDPANVRVICPYVGGGFGCKGNAWPPMTLAAMAARRTGRPVRLELAREQMYSNNGYRPITIQTVKLGASTDGTLRAVRHDGITQMSNPSLGEFAEPVALAARMLYACPNVATSHRLVATNYGLPTYMRAPGEASGVFALECAMDELAVALNTDPVELRLRNYADRDEDMDKPFSSKHLRQAYDEARRRFAWRHVPPRSMRDGHVLVGWGMATATYPANRQPASARVRVLADGTALVQSGTQDIGTGTYTIMAQVAGDVLGLPMARVRVELGDTDLPEAPGSGGSTTAASVTPAVQMAAQSLRARLIGLALSTPGWTNHTPDDVHLQNGTVTGPQGSLTFADLLARARLPSIDAEAGAKPGKSFHDASRHSFGAQFAEVRVDPDFGTVRVSRFVGVYDAGVILNAKTGRSQLLGGVVFGIGQALHEAAIPDLATGRITNANISDYLVPVNADVPDIDVSTIASSDTIVDPLGARGIGELPIVGTAAAIANAVFNATGKRVRRLPIRVEDVLA